MRTLLALAAAVLTAVALMPPPLAGAATFTARQADRLVELRPHANRMRVRDCRWPRAINGGRTWLLRHPWRANRQLRVWKRRHLTAHEDYHGACHRAGQTRSRMVARQLLAAQGLAGQWSCLRDLWGPYESHWNWYADNPGSSAYGIPQALPGSKMGTGWETDVLVQIRWGVKPGGYVNGGRYSSPCSALAYRLVAGYY